MAGCQQEREEDGNETTKHGNSRWMWGGRRPAPMVSLPILPLGSRIPFFGIPVFFLLPRFGYFTSVKRSCFAPHTGQTSGASPTNVAPQTSHT